MDREIFFLYIFVETIQFKMLTENKLNTQIAELTLLISEYSVQELSKCLIREFFIQSKLPKTLQMFQQEDKHHKKINKSTLIKILSMNNLVYYNKQSSKPFRSLLQILVNYLRNKFSDKVHGKKHEPKSDLKSGDNSQTKSMKEDLSVAPSVVGKSFRNQSQQNDQNDNDDEYDNDWENEQQNNTKLMHSVQQERMNKKKQEQKKLIQTAELPLKTQKQVPENQQKKEDTQEFQKKIDCLQVDSETIEGNKMQDLKEMQINKLKTQSNTEKCVQKTDSERRDKQSEKIKKTQNNSRTPTYHPTRPQSAVVGKIDEPMSAGSRMIGMKRFGKKKDEAVDFMITQSKREQEKTKEKLLEVQKQVIKPVLQQKNIGQAIQNKDENKDMKEKEKIMESEDSGPKMVKMFGKKKRKEEEHVQPTKFRFDENFVDKPLGAVVEKYDYEPINMYDIKLENEVEPYKIDYRSKFNLSASKKLTEKEKAITEQQATALKKSIFQGGLAALPKSWHQGFILSPFKETPFGLKQIDGGPCGIIAAVQCYFLKHYLHLAKVTEAQRENQLIRDNCLMAAISDMLYKSRNEQNKIVLALPPKGFAGTKIDFSGLKIYTLDGTTFEGFYQSMLNFRSYFVEKSNHGVTVLMICMIMTKGIETIKKEIDMAESPLIGNHGHCTQELVNLFITGTASSNCFDGEKTLDEDLKIKGIKEKAQFGFLTIFETLKYIEVGKNLKNPIYPFWIICKQFHYHVIFANHYLIGENNEAEKFDIVYFDGLYNCGDRIIITLEKYGFGEQPEKKDKDLPLIEQVMMTKWGKRKSDWNGSIPIL